MNPDLAALGVSAPRPGPDPSPAGATVIRFRPFRNGDPPALVDLWNRGLPERGVVRPLNVHEFDALVIGKLGFEVPGLVVAERDGRILGFAHAGFGPVDPRGPSHKLDFELGTVAMMVLEPGLDDPEVERGLFLGAERYLRDRGAEVIYAGGQYPVNPFYWGLYGSSEFAGVLGAHTDFRRAAERAGYEPVAATVLLEADLARPEPRDPRAPVLRRQVRFDVMDDTLPSGWWEALAIGMFRPTTYRLLDKFDDHAIAYATTWDIAAGFAVGDGRSRTGMIGLEVEPAHRRKGFGRLLVSEVLRHARSQLADLVTAQTSAANEPALALYHLLGFEQVDTATLYRLPADQLDRSRALISLTD
jgi:ribosomal protein S18 acetylase RimI-like enzyme